MNSIYNIMYGIVTGAVLILLIVNALASLHSGINLFGFPMFWAMFLPLAGLGLWLNKKRVNYDI